MLGIINPQCITMIEANLWIIGHEVDNQGLPICNKLIPIVNAWLDQNQDVLSYDECKTKLVVRTY